MIKIRVSGEDIYITNDGLMIANFIKSVNELDVCYNGETRTFSGMFAITLKNNLDAICDKQCPKCLSTDVECTEVEGQAGNSYKWICDYCRHLSKQKQTRKDAYESWHGDKDEK